MSDQTARIKEMLAALSKQGNSKKGLQTLIGMLSQMDRQTEQSILRTLDQQDPALAESLREQYFTFEDLVAMEDAVLKRAFEEVHRSTLAASLKGQPQAIRDKVLTNLSPRAAAMLEDDMDAMGPQPRHIVEEAQREVAEALKRWRNVIL